MNYKIKMISIGDEVDILIDLTFWQVLQVFVCSGFGGGVRLLFLLFGGSIEVDESLPFREEVASSVFSFLTWIFSSCSHTLASSNSSSLLIISWVIFRFLSEFSDVSGDVFGVSATTEVLDVRGVIVFSTGSPRAFSMGIIGVSRRRLFWNLQKFNWSRMRCVSYIVSNIPIFHLFTQRLAFFRSFCQPRFCTFQLLFGFWNEENWSNFYAGIWSSEVQYAANWTRFCHTSQFSA